MVTPKVINVISHSHIQTHQEQKIQGNLLHFHQEFFPKNPQPLHNMIHGS